jgi:hypothetical protein
MTIKQLAPIFIGVLIGGFLFGNGGPFNSCPVTTTQQVN